MPVTRSYDLGIEERKRLDTRNIAFKVARGEIKGNVVIWRQRFPDVFLQVQVEEANKTMRNMLEKIISK